MHSYHGIHDRRTSNCIGACSICQLPEHSHDPITLSYKTCFQCTTAIISATVYNPYLNYSIARIFCRFCSCTNCERAFKRVVQQIGKSHKTLYKYSTSDEVSSRLTRPIESSPSLPTQSDQSPQPSSPTFVHFCSSPTWWNINKISHYRRSTCIVFQHVLYCNLLYSEINSFMHKLVTSFYSSNTIQLLMFYM